MYWHCYYCFGIRLSGTWISSSIVDALIVFSSQLTVSLRKNQNASSHKTWNLQLAVFSMRLISFIIDLCWSYGQSTFRFAIPTDQALHDLRSHHILIETDMNAERREDWPQCVHLYTDEPLEAPEARETIGRLRHCLRANPELDLREWHNLRNTRVCDSGSCWTYYYFRSAEFATPQQASLAIQIWRNSPELLGRGDGPDPKRRRIHGPSWRPGLHPTDVLYKTKPLSNILHLDFATS